MEINPTTATNNARSAVASSEANAVISSDFETFLQMLTAQARFQDPLEPIDSSEYAAQLAQFSMVEQQVLSNDLLTSLTTQLGAGNVTQLAGWIGMEARTSAPVGFNGSPLTLYPSPAPGAEQVNLIVRDGTGAIVQQAQIPVSSEPVLWAGVSDSGAPFPAGAYSFEIDSRRQGQSISTSAVDTYARVTEARLLDGTTQLVLAGGSTISAEEVSGLRAPPEPAAS
ncbi:MAG: flagellar hook capping FlgD N-terminal domain-containing protein [Pseudomonadota bacterium]